MGGLEAMYLINNDKNYLVTAGQIASATMSLLSPNGVLQETCEPRSLLLFLLLFFSSFLLFEILFYSLFGLFILCSTPRGF